MTKALRSTFKGKSTKGVDLSKEEPSLEDEQGGTAEDEQAATVEDGQGTTARSITRYSGQFTASEENTTYDGDGPDGIIFLTPKCHKQYASWKIYQT